MDNRKYFFNQFARENNFDPAVPTNWYSVTREHVLGKKVEKEEDRREKRWGKNILKHDQGAKTVLSHYGGNLARALIHLFPDIGLSKESCMTSHPCFILPSPLLLFFISFSLPHTNSAQ